MKKFNYVSNNKKEVINSLEKMEQVFNEIEKDDLSKYNNSDTAIIFVDMVEGFVEEENVLGSPRALEIIDPINKLINQTENAEYVFLTDSHPKNAVEFETYPEHCLEEDVESLITDRLVGETKEITIVEKNSINGFLAPKFKEWLINNPNITNFVIVGLVTDICVMNFVLTLKAYFNQKNVKSNLVVPVNGVETFTLEVKNHQGDLMNLFALYNMDMNGIKLIQI